VELTTIHRSVKGNLVMENRILLTACLDYTSVQQTVAGRLVLSVLRILLHI